MDIQVDSNGKRRVVHIEGKVTFECCPILQNRLDAIMDEGVNEVVIDFKDVPFIDSSGIGEILRLFKHMREVGGEVVLVNPNQKLQDLFAMYRFGQFMRICQEADLDANNKQFSQ
ncbi:MAG TPA: STAS domain-containing protein [Acidobacteriota bacterium]|nr:STAS domain-containing protein [Acidobacteriota bacterium]